MPTIKHIWFYCKECEKVRKVSPEPACEHVALQHYGRSAAPLTTYFEGPGGQISIPGKEGARIPARLKKLGYEEKTISNAREYSQFCRKMDNEAREKHDRLISARDEQFSAQQKEERAELRRQVKTQFGRDYLEAAIAASESGYGERYDPGSHLEGYEYNGRND